MNKKLYTDTKVLIFLCAYSHQAALSLHRSNNAAWKEVKNFYHNRIMPERVIEYLSGLFNRRDNLRVLSIQDSFIFSNKERMVYRLFMPFRGSYLLEEEVDYYLQLLKELHAFLAEEEVNPYKVANLGLRFSLFIDRHLRWRLRIKDQQVAMSIDHFFANEHLSTMPIERFATGLNF